MRLVHDFAPARRLPPPITFICHGCECVEHRRTPALPKGWTTKQVCADVHAYCADCSDGIPVEVFAAQLRRDHIAFVSILPMLLLCGITFWTMLPS